MAPLRHTFTAALVLIPAVMRAQAWSYPVFQAPIIENREFNLGIADAGRGGGTSLILQWREAAAARSQFTLEAGLVFPDNRRYSTLLALGAQYAYQITRSTRDVPIDLLFTAGGGIALGDPATVRIPIGLNAGHRFELERDMSITPYVHPRLSLDFCGDCGNDAGLSLDFDVGASWEVTRVLALRAAAFFGGGNLFGRDGIGFSVAYRPPGLSR